MRRVRWLLAALALSGGSATAAAEPQSVIVQSIAVAPDYATSGVAHASGHGLGCDGCAVLLQSADRGAGWRPAPATGWSGGSIRAARLAGRPVLLAPGGRGVEVSDDGGRRFRVAVAGSGRLDVAAERGGLVLALSGAAQPAVRRLPRGPDGVASVTGVERPLLAFAPGYPAAGVAPPALATGWQPGTGVPVVARCDAALTCADPVPLVTGRHDLLALYLSPAAARDGVVFAAPSGGGLYRSADGGRGFTPVVVHAPVAGQAVSSVQGMAFTPDFDAAAGRGTAYAAVLVVRQDPKAGEAFGGGVYASHDGGRTWSPVGGLDTGATAVAVAPDGRLFAGYVDLRRGRAGVVCAVSCPAAPATPAKRQPASRPDREPAAGPSGAGTESPGASRVESERDDPAAAGGRSRVTAGAEKVPPRAGGIAGAAVAAGLAVLALGWWRRRARGDGA